MHYPHPYTLMLIAHIRTLEKTQTLIRDDQNFAPHFFQGETIYSVTQRKHVIGCSLEADKRLTLCPKVSTQPSAFRARVISLLLWDSRSQHCSSLGSGPARSDTPAKREVPNTQVTLGF